MPNSYSFNSYGDVQVLFSITNNLDDVKKDSVKPFSFIEFIDNSRQTQKDNNTINLYKIYLQNWNQLNNKSNIESSNIVKEQFINLFKEITLKFTSPEEKRYLQNIDFSNEENISIAVPFFSSKIKEIILYYQERRKTHTKDLKEIKSKGNKTNVSNYIKSKLLDFFENNESEDVETVAQKLSSIQKFVEVDIEDSYDIYNDYFDIDPSKPPDFYAGSDTFTLPNIKFLEEIPKTTTTTTTTPEPLPVIDPLPPVLDFKSISITNDVVVIAGQENLPPVITEATEVNIFFDSSGSMNSTLAPLQTMRDTILDAALMPFYNNNRALYEEKVNVIVDPSERTFLMLATANTNPAADVLNIVFQDESTPYGNESSYLTPTSTYLSDIVGARSNLINRTNNRYVVFQVETDPSGYSPAFAAFLAAVENGTGSYAGSNGLSLTPYKERVKFAFSITPASTPIYYANLIVGEMQNFNFDIPDLPNFIIGPINDVEVNASIAIGLNLSQSNNIELNEAGTIFKLIENENDVTVIQSTSIGIKEISNNNNINVNQSTTFGVNEISNTNGISVYSSIDSTKLISNINGISVYSSIDLVNNISNSNSIGVNQSIDQVNNIANTNSISVNQSIDQVNNISNSNSIGVNSSIDNLVNNIANSNSISVNAAA
tara:strand:+ start:1547 stop:3523 length:1977 start_codon:yes stop_codon:yes gene_type:complete